jgi:hypothetical protein
MKIVELKNTITEIINSLDGFGSRIEMAEESVNLKQNH